MRKRSFLKVSQFEIKKMAYFVDFKLVEKTK